MYNCCIASRYPRVILDSLKRFVFLPRVRHLSNTMNKTVLKLVSSKSFCNILPEFTFLFFLLGKLTQRVTRPLKVVGAEVPFEVNRICNPKSLECLWKSLWIYALTKTSSFPFLWHWSSIPKKTENLLSSALTCTSAQWHSWELPTDNTRNIFGNEIQQ